MPLAVKFFILRAQREIRRAQRRRREQLARELSSYCTQGQRDDLMATLDRYPDGQTAELRGILSSQGFAAQRTRRPFH